MTIKILSSHRYEPVIPSQLAQGRRRSTEGGENMNPVKFVRARCIYTTHSDFHVGELYRFNYTGEWLWKRYFESYNAMFAVCGSESRVLYIESTDRIVAVFDVVKECIV